VVTLRYNEYKSCSQHYSFGGHCSSLQDHATSSCCRARRTLRQRGRMLSGRRQPRSSGWRRRANSSSWQPDGRPTPRTWSFWAKYCASCGGPSTRSPSASARRRMLSDLAQHAVGTSCVRAARVTAGPVWKTLTVRESSLPAATFMLPRSIACTIGSIENVHMAVLQRWPAGPGPRLGGHGCCRWRWMWRRRTRSA
jgi:hypothetical protein